MPQKSQTASRLDERLHEVERRLREVRRSMKALERGRLPSPPLPPPPAAPDRAPAAAAGRAAPRAEEAPPPAAARAAPDERNRFQRYFAHASFPAGAIGRRDRRVMRNKAIAVLIGAIFLAMLIYLMLT